jgi:hypothetical protein
MALQVFEKTSGFKTHALENGWCILADCAALSISYRPARPIDQLQIVSQGNSPGTPNFQSLHSLRHCYGMLLTDAGVDLCAIQQEMDHERPKTTV